MEFQLQEPFSRSLRPSVYYIVHLLLYYVFLSFFLVAWGGVAVKALRY